MFRIEHDPRTRILLISVKGFWTLKDVLPFAAAMHEGVREAKKIGDDFDAIIESLDFPVQANDVADMLTNVMRGGMAQTNGRTAVVVGSQLNKLQAERTLVHPRLKVFLSMEAARDWLAQPPEQSAGA